MKLILVLIFTLSVVFSACGGKKDKPVTLASGENLSEVLPDCTGFKTDMIVPAGVSSIKSGGEKFAKLTAVSGTDGTMKITISPPDGESFATAFINEFSAYKLKFIACREDLSSVGSGSNTTGVCSRSGSINIVGKDNVTSADFLPEGFTANGKTIHATRVPEYDQANSYILKPDFIMLTATYLENDQLGQFMIAYGRSPYYIGCYNK